MTKGARLSSKVIKLGGFAAAIITGALSFAQTTADAAPSGAAALPAKWANLAASATPKTVVLDAKTGRVVRVTARSGSLAPMTVTVHNPCQSGDACWVPDTIPYANYGFAGTGTKTGTWTHRAQMYTHSHSTSVCWSQSPNCSPRLGPNSVIAFNSYPVTGTKVVNYS